MRWFTIISIILFCGLCQPLDAQQQSGRTSCIPVKSLQPDSLAYKAGEQLSFTMHYNWGAINSDVGSATIKLDTTVLNGQKVFFCDVSGKTTKLFDLFFKVREHFSSWFTVEGLRPMRFMRNSYEGKYHAENHYNFIWNAAEPYINADVLSSTRGHKILEIPVDSCTYDLPALFYLARNMDFDRVQPGKKHPMMFAIDDEVFHVYFIMHNKETIKIKGIGNVRTIKFAAKLVAGEVFDGEQDMMIWISDDLNRIPVYFEAPLLVGRARGVISGYSGLKHPFSSLVK